MNVKEEMDCWTSVSSSDAEEEAVNVKDQANNGGILADRDMGIIIKQEVDTETFHFVPIPPHIGDETHQDKTTEDNSDVGIIIKQEVDTEIFHCVSISPDIGDETNLGEHVEGHISMKQGVKEMIQSVPHGNEERVATDQSTNEDEEMDKEQGKIPQGMTHPLNPEMAGSSDHILQLSGWTREEIAVLAHDKQVPGHWFDNPKPTFALMEAIRSAVEESVELSYRKDFPQILKNLGLKEPKALVGMMSKLKRRVTKAVREDLMLLCEEMVDLSPNQVKIIGPICAASGISANWLSDQTNLPDNIVITNGIIAELFVYRRYQGIPWHVVGDKWWRKLFLGEAPPKGTLYGSWESVHKRKQLLSRDASQDEKNLFLSQTYVLPTKQGPRPIKQEEDHSESGNQAFMSVPRWYNSHYIHFVQRQSCT